MTGNGVDASGARPKLRFKKLGNSNLEVPNVCLGTMMFGSTNTGDCVDASNSGYCMPWCNMLSYVHHTCHE